MMIQLYPHQQKIVDSGRTKILLAHSTGTGKTVTSIALTNKHLPFNERVLVIVPKILKEKWLGDMNMFSTTKFTVMTKEEFKAKAKTLERYDAVIVDEGHYFAGIKSQMSKLLYWYLTTHKIEYRFIATATPYLSTPLNIYTLARHLGHEWNYRTFVKEFFYEIPMGFRMIQKVKPNIENKVAALVAQIGDVVDMEEVIEVPEQTIKTVFLSPTKSQKEAIAVVSEDQFIVEWTKKHQIEQGFKYHLGETTEMFDSEKLIWIKNKVDKVIVSGEKIAIFCRYIEQINVIADILKKHDVYKLSGDVKNRHEVIQTVENGGPSVVIIQSSCSVGFELPSINEIIFASLSFSYVDYAQSMGRFLRINKPTKNSYTHLVIKGGVDEDVYNSIMNKQDFSLAIYNKRQDDTQRS